MGDHREHDAGFTLIELVIVVLIIGILVAIAMPAYQETQVEAAKRTCVANQRAIEGGVAVWRSQDPDRSDADVSGIVDVDHPLVVAGMFVRPPSCPSAPSPADPLHPTIAEGGYSLDASATVAWCPFGRLGAHGHF